jgi:tetratricopeptide (TPR) repeat protein
MKKALVFVLPFTALLCPRPFAWGQELQLLDIPGSITAPALVRDLPVSSEVRSALQKALDARDFAGAETVLVKEIERDSKSAQLLTLAGSVFFLDGKYLNSAIALKKAEALAPLDHRSRFTLAMAYITLNHRDWARPELAKLAEAEPLNPTYPYWLGRLDYDSMQFKAAEAHFQKTLNLDAGFMRAYDNLGLTYEALGQYDDAERVYKQAVVLNRQAKQPSPWPALNLGTLLLKLDKLGEAEFYLEESLRYDAQFAKAHYQMGLVLVKGKKDEAAERELQLAIKHDPNFAEPHYALGRIYERTGNKQAADAEFRIFQRLKKDQRSERPS